MMKTDRSNEEEEEDLQEKGENPSEENGKGSNGTKI